MKLKYFKPEILVEELMKEDILLESITGAKKSGTDNSSFDIDSIKSVFDDLVVE